MKLIGIGVISLAISGAAMSATVYKCEKDGKPVYTDEPCLNATQVDVTPTQGLNKWTGIELKGTNPPQQRPRPAIAQNQNTAQDQQPHVDPPRITVEPSPPPQPRYAPPKTYRPGPAEIAAQAGSNLWPIALVFASLAILAAITVGTAGRERKRPEHVWPKRPLSNREQAMFFRLQHALPDHIILAQVAFSALLTAKEQSVRNAFNRKVTDFVVCTKAFEVVTVIELDDATHFGKENQDAKRDAILQMAGYSTLRFANVPDHDELTSAMQALLANPSQQAS